MNDKKQTKNNKLMSSGHGLQRHGGTFLQLAPLATCGAALRPGAEALGAGRSGQGKLLAGRKLGEI